MTEQLTQPVATNTPFPYTQNCVVSVNVSNLARSLEWYRDSEAKEIAFLKEKGAVVITEKEGLKIGEFREIGDARPIAVDGAKDREEIRAATGDQHSDGITHRSRCDAPARFPR